MLVARGLSSGGAPEKWNMEKPEVVKEINLLPAWIAENGGFDQGNEELDDGSHYRSTEC
jgi:hypothetical protein